MPSEIVPTIASRDFFYIAPEIILTIWGLVLLVLDLILLQARPLKSRRNILGSLALLGVLVGLAAVFLDPPTYFGQAYDDLDPILFFGTIAGDTATSRLNFLILSLLGLVVGISMSRDFTDHWGEYYALLFWAAVGMMFLIAAEELLTLFVALEMMTLCLYILAAFEKRALRSPEAGLKYFVYGSVSSALFLFGLSLIYGMTGTTRLDAISHAINPMGIDHPGLNLNVTGAVAILLLLVGFGFKVAIVPFHHWAPDTYEGAPSPVTAWIASGSKIASFVAMLKVFGHALLPWASTGGADMMSPGWIGLLAIVAAVTMTFGNLAALSQRRLKRMLAYSAIAHAGYILVGIVAVASHPNNQVAAGAVLFYLVIYGFTKVSAFAITAWMGRDRGSDDIETLNGLGRVSPFMALCILILLLSFIGIPPTGGFFGKLYLFMEALNSREQGQLSLTWLVALALFNTVLSSFYYVRVLRAMYLRPPGEHSLKEPGPGISLPIVIGTLVTLVLGLLPAPVLDAMKGAASDMLSVSATKPVVVKDQAEKAAVPLRIQPPEDPAVARRQVPTTPAPSS